MELVELNRKSIWLEIYATQVFTAKKKFTVVPNYALTTGE